MNTGLLALGSDGESWCNGWWGGVSYDTFEKGGELRHLKSLTAVGVVFVFMVVACGDSGPPFAVTEETVSGPGTAEMTVWAPDADGSWPIIYAIPGSGGSATRDLDVIANELAKHGVVVVGTDFRNENDVECGYRFAREVAVDYNGDISQPVTILGYSAGATGAVIHGLSEESFGPDSILDVGCPPGVVRPEIIVSINGCHTGTTNIEGRVRFWGNQDARILVISGANDEVCGTVQSEQAQTALQDAGYDVSLVEIPDANHWEVIFHDMAYGTYSTLETDNPSGQATVQAVLDFIGITIAG